MAPVTEVSASGTLGKIEAVLGDDAGLLTHQCRTIPKESLHLPGPDFPTGGLLVEPRENPASRARTWTKPRVM